MAALTSSMFFVVILALCFASVAFGDAGTASFYTNYKPSACYGSQEEGNIIAAANPTLYNNKAACGRRYRVTCTGASCRPGNVVVKIVDLCPECAPGRLDLSKEAFSAIADPVAGIINIDYVQV